MTHLPLITVITPSYNQAHFLEKTILSVLNQKYPNLQYLIFDGNSTDNSVEIIKKYEKNIFYWESQADRGQSHAINKAFAKTQGQLVTWLNSDDQFTENCLWKVADYFEKNPKIALVHGKSLLFGENFERLTQNQHQDLAVQYLAALPFAQPSAFFRGEMLQKVGFLDEKLHFGMDYDLFLRMYLQADFLQVEDTFSKYLIHQHSKTSTAHLQFAKDYTTIFSKLLRSFEADSLILEMKQLEFYQEGTDRYLFDKKIKPEDLEKAFVYHLFYILKFYYEALDTKNAQKICVYLLKNYPQFASKNTEIAKISKRIGFFGKKGISLLRDFRKRIKG